jgi:hypothetical protein
LIEHVWSILCESGAIDYENGHVSLFNVIEILKIFGDSEQINRFPFRFEIFSLWTRFDPNASTKGKMRIVYCKPGGESKPLLELAIDLIDNLFHRTRVHAQGLELNGAGIYKFIVELQEEGMEDWKVVATIPLHVQFESPTNQKK